MDRPAHATKIGRTVRLDLDDLDRHALAAHRRERDQHREPLTWRPSTQLRRRRELQAGLLDALNELAVGGVLQPPVKTGGGQ